MEIWPWNDTKTSQHTWSSWSGRLIIFWLNCLADYPVNFQDIHPLTQLILQVCQTLLRGDFFPRQPLHLMLIFFLFAFQGLHKAKQNVKSKESGSNVRSGWGVEERGFFSPLLGQMKHSTQTKALAEKKIPSHELCSIANYRKSSLSWHTQIRNSWATKNFCMTLARI